MHHLYFISYSLLYIKKYNLVLESKILYDFIKSDFISIKIPATSMHNAKTKNYM